MAEFEIFGESSGGSSRSKSKIDGKKVFALCCGVAAVAGVFVLLRRSTSTSAEPAAVYYPYSTEAGTSASGSGSFISYSDLDSMLSEVGSAIDDIYGYVDSNTATMTEDFTKQLDEHIKNADTRMDEIVETNNTMDYAQAQEIYYQSKINEMISNNRAYDNAGTTAKQENLRAANQLIGNELGLKYHAETGTWWRQDPDGTLTRAFFTAAEEAGAREKISEYPGEVIVVKKEA